MAFAAAEAQVHCDVLIEQRKNLSQEKRRLQKKLDELNKEPPVKVFVGIFLILRNYNKSFYFYDFNNLTSFQRSFITVLCSFIMDVFFLYCYALKLNRFDRFFFL